MIALYESRKGTWHKQAEMPNQDAAIALQIHNATIAVLCDGVSLNYRMEPSHSEEASRFCVKESVAYLRSHLHTNTPDAEMDSLLRSLFVHVRQEMIRYLNAKGIEEGDASTTMLVAIYRKGKLWGGLAGDGGILYERTDRSIAMMVTEIKTSSMVYSLRDSRHWAFFNSLGSPLPVRGVFIATDGVFDTICGWNGQGVVCHVDELFDFWNVSRVKEKQREAYLKARVDEVQSGDDLSVALIEDSHYFHTK